MMVVEGEGKVYRHASAFLLTMFRNPSPPKGSISLPIGPVRWLCINALVIIISGPPAWVVDILHG